MGYDLHYNIRDQLTGVSMPRSGYTQTRSVNYDLPTGRLTSTTNPENGTVSYYYNSDGTLYYKQDAKDGTLASMPLDRIEISFDHESDRLKLYLSDAR